MEKMITVQVHHKNLPDGARTDIVTNDCNCKTIRLSEGIITKIPESAYNNLMDSKITTWSLTKSHPDYPAMVTKKLTNRFVVNKINDEKIVAQKPKEGVGVEDDILRDFK